MSLLNKILSVLLLMFVAGCDDTATTSIVQQSNVTITGQIIDIIDEKTVENAKITVKVGNTFVVNEKDAVDGEVFVEGLPASSDIEIIITSTDDAFVTRAFFLNTGEASSGDAVKDFGFFEVSEPTEIVISVTSSDSNVDNLVFKSYSHVGVSSSVEEYAHIAEFVDGQYKIILPKYINTGIVVNLDTNFDGFADFEPLYGALHNETDLVLYPANLSDTVINLELKPLVSVSNVEYRISLVDSQSLPVTGAKFYVDDQLNALNSSTFDQSTGQYVLNAKFLEAIDIVLPAFSSGEHHYLTDFISIQKNDLGNLTVSKSDYNNCCYTIEETSVIELVVQAKLSEETGDVDLVLVHTSPLAADNGSISFFYSQPVTIAEQEITFKANNDLVVIKGNESSSDDVPLGATQVSSNRTNIPFTYELTLNNTKLTIKPSETLTTGNSYNVNVGIVQRISDGEEFSFAYENSSFLYVGNAQSFDIADIKLDNHNYTTEGELIHPTNTNGEQSWGYNDRNDVQIYLPTSIYSLSELTLELTSYTSNGRVEYTSSEFSLHLSYPPSLRAIFTIDTAANEHVYTDLIHSSPYRSELVYGSAQPGSKHYYAWPTFEYLSDNTPSERNSMTFNYQYKTETGQRKSGIITLPVQ